MLQRIRHSIFPLPARPSSPDRRWLGTALLHFRPRSVDARALRFTLSWGLGGMAATLVLMLLGTGVLLKFAYRPFPDQAYESILALQQLRLFGALIRNLHHWSAHLLVLVVFLHFLRVFFTGAFLPPRQFNWIVGLGLLAAVVAANFTGYLLPWDQLAFWAVTICTGMLDYVPLVGKPLQQLLRGGPEVGSATLANFYTLHTAVVPAVLLLLLPFHFWRVRKAGGLVVAPRPDRDATDPRQRRVPTIPHLLLRELVTALVLVAVVMVLAVAFDAPLGPKANAGLSPNPTKAPWYFAGLQELQLHFHPLVSLFLLPLLAVAGLLVLPYLRYPVGGAGVWFGSTRGRRMALAAAATAGLLATAGVALSEWAALPGGPAQALPVWIRSGLLPFGLTLVASGLGAGLIVRRHRPDRLETVQMLMVMLVVALVMLTAVGTWLRGPGMQMIWPWQS